jgi:hypothetical protein
MPLRAVADTHLMLPPFSRRVAAGRNATDSARPTILLSIDFIPPHYCHGGHARHHCPPLATGRSRNFDVIVTGSSLIHAASIDRPGMHAMPHSNEIIISLFRQAISVLLTDGDMRSSIGHDGMLAASITNILMRQGHLRSHAIRRVITDTMEY